MALASQMADQPTVRYPVEFWKFNGELPLIFLLGCTLIGFGFGGQIPLQETIWGSFFGRRYLGAVRSVGMPFSIIFGAIAVPGAALWGEVTGDLSAPFMATAVCWFAGAILVLFIPKPKKKYSESSPESPDIAIREGYSQLVNEYLPPETPEQNNSPQRRFRLHSNQSKRSKYMTDKD